MKLALFWFAFRLTHFIFVLRSFSVTFELISPFNKFKAASGSLFEFIKSVTIKLWDIFDDNHYYLDTHRYNMPHHNTNINIKLHNSIVVNVECNVCFGVRWFDNYIPYLVHLYSESCPKYKFKWAASQASFFSLSHNKAQ